MRSFPLSRAIVAGATLAALLLAPAAASAPGRSPDLFRDFDPARVPPPDRHAPAPVARILDRYVPRDSLGPRDAPIADVANSLVAVIFLPIWREYIVAGHLEATPEEFAGFVRTFDPKHERPMAAEDSAEVRQMVEQWKANRSLYRRYGGAVIWQQMDPFEPIGAYEALMKEMVGRRVFEIYDGRLANGFWYRFADRSFEIPPGRVILETPWWLSKEFQERLRAEAEGGAPDAGTVAAGEAPRGGFVAAEDIPIPEGAGPEGWVIRGRNVRFTFDPSHFVHATNGSTGQWVKLEDLAIRGASVAGDFNGWSTSAWPLERKGERWVLDRPVTDLGGTGRRSFKFVVNGSWWIEPEAGMPNRSSTALGNKGSNLEIMVP